MVNKRDSCFAVPVSLHQYQPGPLPCSSLCVFIYVSIISHQYVAWCRIFLCRIKLYRSALYTHRNVPADLFYTNDLFLMIRPAYISLKRPIFFRLKYRKIFPDLIFHSRSPPSFFVWTYLVFLSE